jgi:NAD(P)-dependent dehydrogenase (short-subunit alcohol dehydrogenase family)
MPISAAYNASKAALKLYAEALRGRLAAHGVRVSAICPGFVVSPMSDAYPGPTPFRVDATRAAQLIRRGLRKNQACIEFPFTLALVMRALACLPVDWRLFLQRVFRF